MHIDGVYTTFCQEESILLKQHRDRDIAMLFKSIGVDLTLLIQGNLANSWGMLREFLGYVEGIERHVKETEEMQGDSTHFLVQPKSKLPLTWRGLCA